MGLDPGDKKHVGKYSMGMRQRLGLAQAIMEDPEILILDEPMNGLDRQGVKEIRQCLLKLRDQGKTILLASHKVRRISGCSAIGCMRWTRESCSWRENSLSEREVSQLSDLLLRVKMV